MFLVQVFDKKIKIKKNKNWRGGGGAFYFLLENDSKFPFDPIFGVLCMQKNNLTEKEEEAFSFLLFWVVDPSRAKQCFHSDSTQG